MNYSIPLFELNYDHEEEDAVIETIRSKWISTGPKCAELEKAFCDSLNIDHAITLANCTSALHLALVALDIKSGDEVLCPSLSFAATANCIKYVNATPVFCDIESIENPTISPLEIEKKISPKTRAIIVMHYGGFSCDMDAIMKIAKENNLKVIEDACHGPLSEYNGKKLGTIGDVGCFSFYSNKNISTGEGGILVTPHKKVDEKLRLLRSHGMTTMSYHRFKGHATAYDVVDLGYNYRMDDLRASLGLVQLRKLQKDLGKRKIVRDNYIERLSGHPKISIPFELNENFSSNYIFTIVLLDSDCNQRDSVREKLYEKSIQTSLHYPAIHKFSIYKKQSGSLPITEYYVDNTITLPMYGSLKESEIELVCSILLSAIDG